MLTADDVLQDIEFELAQSAITHDDLGQAVLAVRRYYNRLRGQAAPSLRREADIRRALADLLGLNDMLLTLAQETAAAIQSLRLDLRRIARPSGPDDAPSDVDTSARSSILSIEHIADARPAAEIEAAMRFDALHIGLEVQESRLPLGGRVLRRLKTALHNLALFYINRLAQRQTLVNQTYGDRILWLQELVTAQQREIEALKARLDAEARE